jgi:hypothetical protein
MKQSEYNEIDGLLRHLAGSNSSAQAGLAKSVSDDLNPHLDADELSSYAEGALPPATRARYTSHLADCDDCRKVVVQLALASGVVIKKESDTQGAAALSGWKQILAAFFAPAVLRYAVPALAIVLVAVAFVAWRQQQSERASVALNRQADGPASVTQSANSENSKLNASPAEGQPARERAGGAQPSPAKPTATVANEVPATELAKDDKGTDKKSDTKSNKSSDSKPADAPASASGAGVAKEKETAREMDAVKQPAYAPEAAPPPAPRPVSTMAKPPAKVQEEAVEVRDKAEKRKDADRPQGDVASTRGAPAAKKTERKAGEPTYAVGGADAGETRTVRGRHFQRRNGAWVDSAYKSNASTTSVARGSEQYRALIADEPDIDVIATQLSGEVFLVWKGHAYRIH